MRRWIGIGLLLVGSVLLGLLSGQFYFRVYERTIPAAVTTSFQSAAAHGYFLWRGVQVGAGIFVWSLLVLGMARLFRERRR